jgi:hypothetical protein
MRLFVCFHQHIRWILINLSKFKVKHYLIMVQCLIVSHFLNFNNYDNELQS